MKSLNDIDRTTKEGRLLFAALAKITTESQTDKTPEEVLEQLSALADEIDAESIECADKGCVFTKFTPGPWKKGFFKKNGEITALGVFEDSATDGEMVNAICVVTPIDSASPIDNHNADLIAAAPEMYETLNLVNQALNSLAESEGLSHPCHESIKKALAKARGEVNQLSGTNSKK